MMKIIILLPELCQKRIFGVPGVLVSCDFKKHALKEKCFFLDHTDDGCLSSLVDFFGFFINTVNFPSWSGTGLTGWIFCTKTKNSGIKNNILTQQRELEI